MSAVVGVAVLMALGRLLVPFASAWYEHRTYKRYYEEGRVTAERYLITSEKLMKGEFALSFTK